MPRSPLEGGLPPFRGGGTDPSLVEKPPDEALGGVDLLGLEHLEGVGNARVVHMYEDTEKVPGLPSRFFPAARGEVRGLL